MRPAAVILAVIAALALLRGAGVCAPAPSMADAEAALRSPDAELRASATYWIGATGDPRAAEVLAGALRDPSVMVRSCATFALARMADPRAAEVLLAALADPARPIAGSMPSAIEAVAKARPPGLADVMLALLRTEGGEAGFLAARTLGELRDPRAVEPLLDVLKRPDDAVPPTGAHYDPRSGAAQALGALGEPRAAPLLLALFVSNDWEVRNNAAIALTRLGPTGVDTLIAALRHPKAQVRSLAAETMARVTDPRAVAPMVAALRDEHAWVRAAAARAQVTRKDPEAVEGLIAQLQGRDHYMPNPAADALGAIGDVRAVEPLIALVGPDGRTTGPVIRALGKLHDARAVAPLIVVLTGEVAIYEPPPGSYDGEPPLNDSAALALTEIGTPAVEPLIAVLRDARPPRGYGGDGWPVPRLAAQALKTITGRDFGEDAERWQAWLEAQ